MPSNDKRTTHYSDTGKRKEKLTKLGEYAKIINIFEKWLYQGQRPFEENKTISSIDKGCDLSLEMLSYNLTEIRLANLRNPLSFFKNKYFHNS